MAGVLVQFGWPPLVRPKPEPRVFPICRIDLKALQLETAKEILAEVFGTTSADVEEMIRLRLAEREF